MPHLEEEAHIAGATAQAEKYQNEVEQWKQQLVFAEEIEKQMQVRIDQDIAKLAFRDSELRGLREVAIKAEEAIEQLLSFQNGSPLPTYDKGWKLGYELCENWLAAYRKIKPEIKP